jgi:hypothetical protein
MRPGDPAEPLPAPGIVVVDGKKGIFIPLDAADLTGGRPAGELAKMIEALQSVLVEKERELLGFKERIAELSAPPQSPDDFSAALQSTVDSLQTELSRLSNPIANFAIKEFKIDTRVGVKITSLGTIEYRFAGPGERVSAESQSQLSLTLVPVEKADQSSKDLDRFLAPLRPIAQIADLAKKVISKDLSAQNYFEANHIYTIGEFLRVGSRANIQARIVAATQIDSKTLGRWLDIAELLLIKDLDYPMITQMQEAGINGMRGLQNADAEKTVAKLKRADISAEKFKLWQTIAARYLEHDSTRS